MLEPPPQEPCSTQASDSTKRLPPEKHLLSRVLLESNREFLKLGLNT